MEILKIAAVALTGVILASVMKTVNKEITIYIILATVIILFLSIIDKLWEAFRFLEGIYDNVTYGRSFPNIFTIKVPCVNVFSPGSPVR